MLHETQRQSTTVRESTSASYRHAALRENVPGCGESSEFIAKFSRTLVASLPERRTARDTKQCEVGPTTTPCRSSETGFKEHITARSHLRRTYHRSMDIEAYRTADSERIRYPLYQCRSLEIAAPEFRMELPETGETRIATGRKSDRGMESKNMAPDKKKPEDLGPILRFWMKADSCSFPLSEKPGLRSDALPSCGTVIDGKEYRRLAALQYRREIKGSGFTSVFTRITSLGMKLSAFFDICFAMCANRWFSYGTEGRFINVRMLRPSWIKRTVSTCIDFPAMLPSSIRLSTFGRMASAICRTARMKLQTAWVRICDARWVEYVVRKVFSGRVLSIRNFHGLETVVSIIS